MKIDVPWLITNFNNFNRLYFGETLPVPRLGLSKAQTRLGTYACKFRTEIRGPRRIDVVKHPYNHTIRLSIFFDQTERQYQETLLHEMIHYYISFHEIKDSSPHGTIFRQWMEKLNRQGWNITISEKRGQFAGNADKSSPRVVLAMTLTDGKYMLSSVNPKYAKDLLAKAADNKRVATQRLYFTADPFFNHYPQVRSLRGIYVTKEVFDQKTSQMERIEL